MKTRKKRKKLTLNKMSIVDLDERFIAVLDTKEGTFRVKGGVEDNPEPWPSEKRTCGAQSCNDPVTCDC